MEQDKQPKYDLTIRIAGNAEIPCFSAVKAKGYKVTLTHFQDSEYSDWKAEKDNRLFSATNPVELLGLIAMWEVLGDDWRVNGNSRADRAAYDEVCNNAPEYSQDEE